MQYLYTLQGTFTLYSCTLKTFLAISESAEHETGGHLETQPRMQSDITELSSDT